MPAQRRYTRCISAVRGSVERVFGVLLKQFGIIALPSKPWSRDHMRSIIRACVIIHNMIVSKRRGFFAHNITVSHQNGSENAHNSYLVLSPALEVQDKLLLQALHHATIADDVTSLSKNVKLQKLPMRLHGCSHWSSKSMISSRGAMNCFNF